MVIEVFEFMLCRKHLVHSGRHLHLAFYLVSCTTLSFNLLSCELLQPSPCLVYGPVPFIPVYLRFKFNQKRFIDSFN